MANNIFVWVILYTTVMGSGPDRLCSQRAKMVKTQLEPEGITDPATLKGMEKVPRHEFVPKRLKNRAYEDCPLPIGKGQTISQPFMGHTLPRP